MKPEKQSSASELTGKVAVITGASRGIGLAIAKALHAAGCQLALGSRSRSGVDSAAKELGGREALAEVCDVRNPQSVESFFAAISKKFGRVDMLINNAGVAHAMSDIESLPLESWNDVMATNLTGLFLCVRAALPLMKSGGTIVNNLSGAAKVTFKGLAAYVASKHGALGFTNALREEARTRGIRVVALLPGATDTDIWQQFWAEAPRAKMISPETVADAVVHVVLLPPEAAITELMIGPVVGVL
jgi:NAD(P)-dependent dehydrogenase (short-subunit alcohol dehydrogenase family)